MVLGVLYGISVGTGDPELITLKGLRLLQQVKIVAFPAGMAGKVGVAEKIITPWRQSSQHCLPLKFPYVQDIQVLQQAWQEAAKQVLHYLQQGEDVAFACEGDISFYSTFTYLADTVHQLVPEVKIITVPGVCSPMAAANSLGIPLTVRDQRLAVIPALYQVEELEEVLKWADVIVLMKISSVYSQIWPILQKHQLLKQSWLVEKATSTEEVIYHNLSDRPQLKLAYFSLLIVKVTG